MTASCIKIGAGAHVNGYDVLALPDKLIVHRAGETRHHPVPNFGTDIGELAGRPGARVGWARFPDDAEVIYVYDRDDDNFGYALNLTAPDCSEWGYAPFRDEV
jgi:hypothetical protein